AAASAGGTRGGPAWAELRRLIPGGSPERLQGESFLTPRRSAHGGGAKPRNVRWRHYSGPQQRCGMATAAGRGGGSGARTPVVLEVLQAVAASLAADTGRPCLDIVDAGGGTGGFAVPLASMGHSVTVIDPSPDSLAAAQRRAAEQNVPL